MASFTDQILGFNPYVQQLPVDAMVKVGLQKQAQYDQGVQRIQSYVDNVAGLNVVKPIHKQYLQSKLNELGGNLKKVAAGDFSNFQLVNSVGGMANQIIKDPTIQNAVRSTQQASKEQQNIQAAQKAGKSNPNNEDFYYDQYSKWLNDGKLDTPFTAEFTEYKDVDAKLRDLQSKLKEEEIGIENPYMRNEEGQTLYYYIDPKTKKETSSTDPSKGEKRYALDMLSVKVKGVSAQRILNNFYESLDANDIRQMKIDSWAHYRGAGPESFQSDIKTSYDNKKQMMSQHLVDLTVKLQNPKITGEDKTKIQNEIAQINSDIDNKVLDKEFSDDMLELQNPRNLEEYKYKLYTQTHLTNLAKDLSYRSYVQELKTNPAAAADLARQQFQFEKIKEANDNYWKGKNYDLAVSTETYKRERDRLKDYAEKVGKGYNVVPGSWKTGGEAPTVEGLVTDMQSYAKEYNTTLTKYAQALYPSDNKDYKNLTPAQKEAALNQDLANYRKNPNMPLGPTKRVYLEQLRTMGSNLTKKINAWSSANDYKNQLLQNQSITSNGVTYTGKDVSDFNSTLNRFKVAGEETTDPLSGATVPAQVMFDGKAALNFYKTYQNGKFLPMAKAYVSDQSGFKGIGSLYSSNTDDQNLVSFMNNVGKSVDPLISNYIAKISPVYAVQRAAINTADPAKAAMLNEFLAVKAAEAGEMGGLDVNNPGDYNADVIASNKDAKETSFVIEKGKDGSANVVMRGKGGIVQIIPATDQQVATYFPEVAVTSPFGDIKDDIATSRGHTTNAANERFIPGSGATAVNAQISGYDEKHLPQLRGTGYEDKVRIDVEGFEGNTGDVMTDKYTIIMYVPDYKTGGWKGDYVTGTNGGSYVSEADVTRIFGMISPYTINQAIKTFK